MEEINDKSAGSFGGRMKLLCLFGIHKWFNWRVDAAYRFCKRCGKWRHIEFYSNRTSEWVRCANPKEEE